MARPQGLLKRGHRWYSNIKVPSNLIKAIGKEIIRDSLGTSDYTEACRRIVYEKARWRAIFDNAKRDLSRIVAPIRAEENRIITLSDREAFELAARYLAKKERETREWMQTEGRFLPPHELREIGVNFNMDAAWFQEGCEAFPASDGTEELNRYLEEQGIVCAETSPAFEKLRILIYQAHLEHLERSEDLVKGKPIEERNNLFKNIHAHSPATENSPRYTVNDLIANHEKRHALRRRSFKTKIAARPALRLLREVLGGSKPLKSISFDDMDRLFEVMQNVPLNATKRYKGMTYQEATEAAKNAGDREKPAANTNWATYAHIRGAFSFAVEDGLMEKNLAAAPRYKNLFEKEDSKPKEQFTIPQLNELFRSPLYTGCLNDERGYAKVGSLKPRRGRFWVPLMALFHGMRNNEACQVYTEDVKLEDGVHYIAIKETLDEATISEKKLKTKTSIRNVPIHPELIKMGFLDFVSERRNDGSSPRLFPDLKPGKTGYFSDSFSKWFSRFVKSSLPDCTATLHSFRHQFRDATRTARLSNETVGRIAGWDDGGEGAKLQMNRYGRGPEYLRHLSEEISKIEYPGLVLSHLYATASNKMTNPRRLRE